MDEEAVVHIHNGILLSHKKECIWVRSNVIDEPGAYYTEWSKSEREKQILFDIIYMWNLEKKMNGYRFSTYIQCNITQP